MACCRGRQTAGGKMRHIDFTSGPVGRKILLFSLPLMVGNVFQQLYNVVDTLVVGKFLGEAPLAAVGSAYTLMIFLHTDWSYHGGRRLFFPLLRQEKF